MANDNIDVLPGCGIRNNLNREEVDRADERFNELQQTVTIAGLNKQELKTFSELPSEKQISLINREEIGRFRRTWFKILRHLSSDSFEEKLNRTAQKFEKLFFKKLQKEAETLRKQNWISHEIEPDGQKGAMARLASTIHTLYLNQDEVSSSRIRLHEWLRDPQDKIAESSEMKLMGDLIQAIQAYNQHAILDKGG